MMNCHLARLIQWIAFAATFMLVIITLLLNLVIASVWIFGILLCANVLFGFLFVRCPYCRRSLARHPAFLPEYCPYCGEKL